MAENHAILYMLRLMGMLMPSLHRECTESLIGYRLCRVTLKMCTWPNITLCYFTLREEIIES